MEIDANIDKIILGMKGESKVRDYLKSMKADFMQIDIMFYLDNQLYVAEVKTQERFKAPPFDGHGLPPYQMNKRIELSEKINAMPILFIVDIDDNNIYYNDLRILKKGKSFLTKTGKRIIFPLENFKIIIQ